MIFNRLTRFLRKHRQAFLVCAMMPLAAMDAQTIMGCGCTGHFESFCQCNSCESSAVSPTAVSSAAAMADPHQSLLHACCSKALPNARHVSRVALSAHGANGVRAHQCKQLRMRIGDSVIAAAAQASHDNQIAAVTLLPTGLSIDDAAAATRHFFSFDSGPPPCDVVVTLHRLII
jgi:hypothetical protein